MEISYTTKKKSKEEQQEKFLKLDPAGRFQSFLALVETISLFGVKENDSNKMYNMKDNFVIQKKIRD
ncbi:hypothetical protein ACW6QP_08575 [Salegentibacter sp. HM20]